jgi:hypothetical protein
MGTLAYPPTDTTTLGFSRSSSDRASLFAFAITGTIRRLCRIPRGLRLRRSPRTLNSVDGNDVLVMRETSTPRSEPT